MVAEVILPVLVVVMLPLVDSAPSSLIVSFVDPADWMAKAVLVAPLVSLIKNPMPVPALTRLKPFASPLFVRLNEVGVVKPEARVKSIFLPSVVVMVLPALYACCRVTLRAFEEQTEN